MNSTGTPKLLVTPWILEKCSVDTPSNRKDVERELFPQIRFRQKAISDKAGCFLIRSRGLIPMMTKAEGGEI